MHCGEEKVAKIIIIRTCRMLYKSRQVDLIFPPKITGTTVTALYFQVSHISCIIMNTSITLSYNNIALTTITV